MILGGGEWISVADLPRGEASSAPPRAPTGENLKEAVRAYERSHIENVLNRMDGDKKAAAELLGLSLSSLYRKLEELDVQPE